MKERNLHTILDGFQKMELQDLGNILGNDLSPRLRKSQLVDQLHTYLRAEPRRWMSHLMERDVRLLRELVHAGPEKVQYQDFADYPSLLEVTGLVEYDDSDEHYHKVWISRELYEIVAPEVEKVIGSGERSGQFEVERIGLGYLNLYGILPTDQFVNLMMDWYEQVHGADFHRLSNMLRQSPLVKMYRYNDSWGDYVCSPCLDNVDEIFSLREQLNQRGFKPFTSADAREAGAGAPYFTVGMKTPEGMRLEQMYRRLGYEGYELVKAAHDTWMEAQYTAGQNDALFQPLVDSPLYPELDDESWLTCCQIVSDYADSVPKWFLCGRNARDTGLCKADWEAWKTLPESHNEEEKEDYPHWSMPEPTISDGYAKELSAQEFPLGFAIPHVAPEDPCPCGSGLRYCRCHGKFLS
ncbi:MAG: SEC-C domain-containing protein [Bacteroidales bacterium]|nr:SEC-C domain-containing protein [Bacteroidales bacterium]